MTVKSTNITNSLAQAHLKQKAVEVAKFCH